MAGPIIEALRRFRENAPARREARRNFIRDLIDPMASIEDTDRMQSVGVFRRPIRRGGAFSSLGGVQTANHAHKGRAQIMPVPRKMQEDPAGPDLTPDRAYDGDGTGTPMQTTQFTRPRNTQPENPDRTAGTAAIPPVRSESIALPPPSDALEPPALVEARRLHGERAAVAGRLPQALAASTGDAAKDQMVAVAIQQQMHDAREELRRQEELHRNSPEYASRQQEQMMERAFQTGNWETFHQNATTGAMIRDNKGVPVAIDNDMARRIAQPFVSKRVWGSFLQNNGLPADPADRAALVQATRYAFPPVMTGPKDKEEADYGATVARIQAYFNGNFNQPGDPVLAEYFRKLAIATAGPKSQYQTGK